MRFVSFKRAAVNVDVHIVPEQVVVVTSIPGEPEQSEIITTNDWYKVVGTPTQVLEKLGGTTYPEARPMTLYAVARGEIPTFYLDANVQGILSEKDAARVAERVLAIKVTEQHVTRIDYNVTP